MKTLSLKSIILIAAIGVLSYSGAMAQKKVAQVPSVVNSAFTSQYPQASLKSWTMDKGQYIATFKYDNREWTAHYSAEGNWLRSERNIKNMANVPYSVRAAIKSSKYASYHVDAIARLQMPDHSNMYRVRVDNNNGNETAYQGAGAVDAESLYFSEGGSLIRTASNDNE
jgi:hypothetical protein